MYKRQDLEAVADEGVEALKAAWGKSDLDFRTHVMAKDAAWWNGLKAKAAQVESA